MLFRGFLLTLFMALLPAPQTKAIEPNELDGSWIEVIYRPSREEHPSPLAPREPATLVFEGHQVSWKNGGRTSRQSLVKFVPGQKIKALDLATVVGDDFWISRAIYKVEGDTLTICEAVHDKARPTEFRRWMGVGDPFTSLTTYKRLVPFSAQKVGEIAPTVDGIAPDGSPLDPKALSGKIVLLTFWRGDDEALARHFAKLREVRRQFIAEKKLQIVSLRIDGSGFADWLKFLDNQPPLDPEFPRRRIYDDPMWWHYFHASVNEVGRNPFGVGRDPESFLIGTDGKLLAAKVPDTDLVAAVAKVLKSQP